MNIRTILADHGIEDASKATSDGDFGELIKRITDLVNTLTRLSEMV